MKRWFGIGIVLVVVISVLVIAAEFYGDSVVIYVYNTCGLAQIH